MSGLDLKPRGIIAYRSGEFVDGINLAIGDDSYERQALQQFERGLQSFAARRFYGPNYSPRGFPCTMNTIGPIAAVQTFGAGFTSRQASVSARAADDLIQ